MKELKTARLLLRPFQESDSEDFYEYASQPDVGPNAGWQPHTNREDSLALLKVFIREDEVWAIVWKENGKVIGSLGLHKNGRANGGIASREVGYVLSHDYWGRGIMQEAVKAAVSFAFTEWELEILSVTHFPDNERSRNVIQKCGFTYEGTLRMDCRRYDGVPLDHCMYSMTRQEWENSRIR